MGLDLALRALDLPRQQLALDDLAFLHAGALQQALGALRVAEDAHQVVFDRQVEAARARVALAARTAAQLVVDAARLVALGADDVQAARREHLRVALAPVLLECRAASASVGASSSASSASRLPPSTMSVPRPAMLVAMVTVPGPAGLDDDLRLALVLLGVQHLVRNLVLLQQARQELRRLDRGRADQHRLPALMAVLDVLDDRLELVFLRQVHEIRRVLADHRPVRRDHHDLEAVDLLELVGLGVGRAGHARELLVQAEVVLEGDRGDRLVLLAHAHAFLGLDRLVQAIGPAPARHRAAGELVDDDHLAVAHDVFDVALVERVRAQRRVQVMHQADVGRVVEALALGSRPAFDHQLLDVLVAILGEVHLLALLVDRVVAGHEELGSALAWRLASTSIR